MHFCFGIMCWSLFLSLQAQPGPSSCGGGVVQGGWYNAPSAIPSSLTPPVIMAINLTYPAVPLADPWNVTFSPPNSSGNWTHDDPWNNGSSSTPEIMVHMHEESELKHFSAWYQGVHGYIAAAVSIFGIISNMMNVVVLTQKNMITSTNYILVALAIADMMTMTIYLPNAIYFYCLTVPSPTYPHKHGWIVYLLFNTNFIITCHTIAMWLTVALAVFRYIVVCHHTLGPALCNLWRAKVTIIAVFIATVIFCIPNYIMFKPEKNLETGGWWFRENSYITSFHKTFNYWVFGVVLKVAPCVLLTVLSTLLIRAMHVAEQKRRRLKSMGKRVEAERSSEHNRTTAMLVAVVLCFVITELPQGILAFLSGVDTNIFLNVYVPLGDVWDIIVLINSAVNFLLYCSMSRQFRQTFKDVFLSWCPQPLNNNHATPNGVQYSTINAGSTTTTKL